MAEKITERRIVDVLIAHLRDSSTVKRELSHYEKRIDVVAYCADSKEISGFEAKTSNWKRAIQQARLNLTAVDFSYIAIWRETVHRVDREMLREHGLGLVAVGTKWGDVEWLVEPTKSSLTNRFIRIQHAEWTKA